MTSVVAAIGAAAKELTDDGGGHWLSTRRCYSSGNDVDVLLVERSGYTDTVTVDARRGYSGKPDTSCQALRSIHVTSSGRTVIGQP